MNPKQKVTLDGTLFVLMAMLAIFSFHALKTQQFYSPFPGGLERVATVIDQVNVVKAKSSNSLSWGPLTPGQKLYHFDQIFTHDNSELELDFDDAPIMKVQENTLLRLKKEEGRTQLELEKGLILASLGGEKQKRELVFSLNGRIFTLEADQADVQIVSDGKEASIQVVKGQASLSQEGGDKLVLNDHEQAQIGRGEQAISKLAYELVKPDLGEEFYVRDLKLVGFEIEKLRDDSSDQLYLHLASDPFFLNSVEKIEYRKNLSTQLKEGKYYWRIEDKNGMALSLNSFFQVKLEQRPLWQRPQQSRLHFSFSAEEEVNIEVPFQWELEDVDLFSIEISRNKKNYDQKEVQGNRLNYIFEQSGVYQVRVRANSHKRKEALISVPIAVYISQGRWQAPSELKPAHQSRYVYYDKDQKLQVSWLSSNYFNKTNVRYELEVKRPLENTRIYETKDLEQFIELDQSGEYSWRVKEIGQKESSEFSQWQTFFVEIIESDDSLSQEGVVIELDRPNQLVDFSWSKNSKSNAYTFELARDPEFSELKQQQEVEGTRTKIQVPETGVYYWRAKSRDETGAKAYSKPQKVLITPSAPPPKPNLDSAPEVEYLESNNNTSRPSDFFEHFLGIFISKVYAQDNEFQKVKITWPKAPMEVKAYKIRIYDQAGEVVLETQTQKPELIWEQALLGNFRWEMAYIDFWDRTGPFSDPKDLKIEKRNVDSGQLSLKTSTENETRPRPEIQLLNPQHGLELKLAKTINFRWQMNHFDWPIEQQFIEISDSLDFSNPLTSKEVPAKERELSIGLQNSLFSTKTNRNLYWRVRVYAPQTEKAEVKEYLSKRRRLDLKRRRIEKPLARSQKIAPSQESSESHSLDFSYKASLIDFTQGLATNTIVVEGESVVGAQLRGVYKSWEADLLFQSGEVFNDQSYRSTRLKLGRRWESSFYDKFQYALFAKLSRQSSYFLEGETVIEEAKQYVSLLPALSYQIDSLGTTMQLGYELGQVSGPWFESTTELGSYLFGVEFFQYKYNDEQELQGLSLSLGRRFSF